MYTLPSLTARIGATLGASLVAIGCTQAATETPAIPELNRSVAVRLTCPAVDDLTYFVPRELLLPEELGVMDARRRTPKARAPVFPEFLQLAKLDSLSCGVDVPETYRFIYYRSYQPVFVIAVRRESAAWSVRTFETNDPHQRLPLAIASSNTRTPSRPEFERFAQSLRGRDFWDIPTRGEPFAEGADWAQWVFEGRKGLRYHLVVRYPRIPAEIGITQLGEAFASVAALEWPPKDR